MRFKYPLIAQGYSTGGSARAKGAGLELFLKRGKQIDSAHEQRKEKAEKLGTMLSPLK